MQEHQVFGLVFRSVFSPIVVEDERDMAMGVRSDKREVIRDIEEGGARRRRRGRRLFGAATLLRKSQQAA